MELADWLASARELAQQAKGSEASKPGHSATSQVKAPSSPFSSLAACPTALSPCWAKWETMAR